MNPVSTSFIKRIGWIFGILAWLFEGQRTWIEAPCLAVILLQVYGPSVVAFALYLRHHPPLCLLAIIGCEYNFDNFPSKYRKSKGITNFLYLGNSHQIYGDIILWLLCGFFRVCFAHMYNPFNLTHQAQLPSPLWTRTDDCSGFLFHRMESTKRFVEFFYRVFK